MSSSGHIADMIARFRAGRAELDLRRRRRSEQEVLRSITSTSQEDHLDIPPGTKEGSIEFQSQMRAQRIKEQKNVLLTLLLSIVSLLGLVFLIYFLTSD